jgi:RNA-binding protein PNO1
MAECTLCCSWKFKPSGKPQCYNERSGAAECRSLMHYWNCGSDRLEVTVVSMYLQNPNIVLLSFSLQVRFNTKTRSVEMKTSPHTLDVGGLQKGADFVSAFMMGFEVQDAVALLRLDDLYVESFQVTDVKMLKGDHLSRAIGRIAGQDGKTRFAIENATRTRIVVADQRVHMLGSYANLRVARNAICDLVLGAPPGKVYNNMRNVAKRMNERY